MEKTSAYVLILLTVLVIFGLSQNYVGQVPRTLTDNRYETTYEGVESGTFQVVAKPTEQTYIPRQKPAYITGNTTNQTNHTACISNTCRIVLGPGPNQCWPIGSSCGIIVTPAPIVNCVDTDTNNYPTINFFVKGTATQDSPFYASYTDTCNTPILLKEYFCNSPNGTISPIGVNCTSFNMSCSNGRCV